MPFRSSPDEVLRRHSILMARLEEIRPQIATLRQLEVEAKELERTIASEAASVERRYSLPLLDSVRIASPCQEPWEEMTGDERVRFCRRCEKRVYNLSALGREQAERLVFEHEGSLCARFFRRSDGTILTADCPTGRRYRSSFLRVGISALIAGILGALGLHKSVPAPTPPKALAPSVERSTPHQFDRYGRGSWGLGMIPRRSPDSRFTGFEIAEPKNRR